VLAVDVEKRSAHSRSPRASKPGGVTALFGPSGAGKTTVVNMIAGLIVPDRGSIALDDTVLFDAAAGVNVPPHRRRIGYVFQEGRLFPHLSVRQNLDYGRRMSGHPARSGKFARIVELLDIGQLLDRRPRRLSGGERQRIAIGRALLMRPRSCCSTSRWPRSMPDTSAKFFPTSSACATSRACRWSMSAIRHRTAPIATKVVRIDAGRVVAVGGLELLKDADAPWPE
jgi:molybdate transport system ATP-binding protein